MTANPTVCFSSSGEQNSWSWKAGSIAKSASQKKLRNGSGVFEPFHSAHGPADDSWRSLQDLTFRRRIQRCALELWGVKLAELGFRPARGGPQGRQTGDSPASPFFFFRPGFVKPAAVCQSPCRRNHTASSGYGVFKPFRSLYSAPLRDPPLRARPHSVESTVVCCTWLRKYRSPPFEFHASAVHGNAEHRSTRQVVVRAYGRAPKALHRHQTALATDIESSRLAAPAIVARIQPVVQWSFTFGASTK